MNSVKVTAPTCEYRTNPVGIDVKQPRLSWKLQSAQRGMLQKAYQIQVTKKPDSFDELLWDSGEVDSEQSVHVEYEGPALQPRTRYFYRVKVWSQEGESSDWSETAWWETGFLGCDDWKAQWITPDPASIDPLSEPAFLLRKKFTASGKVVRARIYGTGVGLYELFLNGERVGDELLAPGWTTYHKRLQFQTYDVTDRLSIGDNAMGIMLGDGWYKGNLGWDNKRHLYGDRRAAYFELRVTYEDGTEEVVATDHSWKASTGPIRFAELYQGETYDARLEQEGWSRPEFEDTDWVPAVMQKMPELPLVAQENSPIRVTDILSPLEVITTPAGDTVLDMGQNMVGRMRIKVSAPAGTVVTLKHAEVLDRDGNIYFGNLRKADQLVTYITKGEGVEEYAPTFTFQGFRYVKVEGYPGQENGLPLENFVGEVIHSDMTPTGDFECSNPLVNQLQHNIVWGQKGNFVDVPTDCPQRDERLGWTGDAQVFIDTALFNYQGGPFFTKWLRDLKAEQFENGGVPFVIPAVIPGDSAAAWSDAATIIPWTMYLTYGDKRILEEQYESMKGWVEYMRSQGDDEHLWMKVFNFGDWLAPDAPSNSYSGATPKDFIATAFYAYSTRIVRDAAEVLGKQEDVRMYSQLLEGIVKAFNREFVSPSGRLASPTQTAHVLALAFDLVQGDVKKRTAMELNELVVAQDYHLSTGFVGTPFLCPVLSANGYHETAVKLLLKEDLPSWLYSVKKGATTIWEHWDGIREDGSFWSDNMNSFNHYSYGAIGSWMYRSLAGLDRHQSEPGYKKIRIEPKFGGYSLTYATASLESMYGQIQSGWSISEDSIKLKAVIPPNTTAEIVLPHARLESVREQSTAIEQADGVFSCIQEDDRVILQVGSGTYSFSYPNERGVKPIYSEHTLLIDVMEDGRAMEILQKHAPGITVPPRVIAMKTKTLEEISKSREAGISRETIDALLKELNGHELSLSGK
ncbi:alpha-L-rhamnosidase [Saccharibacillus kuerlensis]|uniref:alpha-L-rhamnosidase n=1 Tax=Saccharibacillus kuerlensis TaxID=459527 RepID=A0ABQ2L140_9BACL|nr:alpha-L-rhamnosidase [Saccharibacillus kuerlensis]GGN99225.1 alfa-L-rhamnosidase [Saccharibacillus kuerlensis]